ncbi:uncharacterized protein LOC102803446 [Saccoglossus kowalevskii]|uniref:Uncharacterized protein LOC102803446 n=1 Tax=Saccoglossus kowalevskii TaxID=10224 RepID=A0ABM0M7H6_SACKO|nr:PREDICTED: uncharacterized protein LOC102803446 [Saccoglossus kowalevskii]
MVPGPGPVRVRVCLDSRQNIKENQHGKDHIEAEKSKDNQEVVALLDHVVSVAAEDVVGKLCENIYLLCKCEDKSVEYFIFATLCKSKLIFAALNMMCINFKLDLDPVICFKYTWCVNVGEAT